MNEVFEVAEAFIKHALETHPGKIGLIGYYGSYATGTATPQSDLDLIYVPDSIKETINLYNSFILDDRPHEFWPMSWERLGRISQAEEHWAVSAGLLMNMKILYSRSKEDLERFNGLKDSLAALLNPERKPEMIKKALHEYKNVLNNLGKLRIEAAMESLPGIKFTGYDLVISCLECLALLNQTYFNYGWDKNLQEVLELSVKPDKLCEHMETITLSKNIEKILETSEKLAYETRELLIEAQRETATVSSIQEELEDYYPGIIEYINKINSGIEKNDPFKANFAAANIQGELSTMLSKGVTGVGDREFNLYSEIYPVYRDQGFPDLLESSDDIHKLGEATKKFEECTHSLFRSQGLRQNRVYGINQLVRLFRERV